MVDWVGGSCCVVAAREDTAPGSDRKAFAGAPRAEKAIRRLVFVLLLLLLLLLLSGHNRLDGRAGRTCQPRRSHRADPCPRLAAHPDRASVSSTCTVSRRG